MLGQDIKDGRSDWTFVWITSKKRLNRKENSVLYLLFEERRGDWKRRGDFFLCFEALCPPSGPRSGGGKGFRQPPRSGLHFWELLNGVGNCSAPGSTDLGASALPSTHPLSSGLWEGRPGGAMGLSGPPSVDACGCGPSRRLGLILFHSRPLDGD